MKISSKGRYALASMINMAQTVSKGENITVLALSQRLDISKIYLEQVFSLLKRSGLVTSNKGALGGYQLSRPASGISAYDVLAATETALFEDVDNTVGFTAPGIENAMQNMLFSPINKTLKETLQGVSLLDLADEVQRKSSEDGYMYYL